MDIKTLIGMSFVCALGAISPGPSLVVVLRNTVSGGRISGAMTGVGHGIGLTVYAFIAVMGLSSILIANEQIFKALQWAGALVLTWLAFNLITNNPSNSTKSYKSSQRRGFLEGFMISFLNPKILVFMVAVFSQFINPDITNYGRIIMAIVAGAIDTAWYVLVATVLASTSMVDKLRLHAIIIDRVIGLVFLILATMLIIKTMV